MPFFADTQDTAQRYGKYITEFQELFGANDVSFGSPEDFFRLAPRLARDESFREGFTSLTKSVAKHEEGRLSLTRMLTIVAMAMGGREIAQTGDEGAVPVSLMVVFLAGIGGWSETESAPAGMAAAEAARETRNGSGGVPATTASEGGGQTGDQTDVLTDEEREAKEFEQRLAAGPEEDLEALTTSLFGGPAQVKEALSRLEMNTLQMKMHLDSIDSRMERIEPHLDDLKSKMPTQPGAVGRSEETERLEPLPVPEMKPWPKESEEAPHPEWAASAPPMKEWPSEKEQDLVWEPKAGEKTPSARAAWPAAAEAAPEWRVPMRENEPEQETFRRETFAGRRTLAQGAAPLRMEPESRAAFDDDPRIRVPFDRYLSQEEEPRRGRRLAGTFAGIVVMLAIIAGLLYSRQGWEGYHDAGHTAAAAIAAGRATVAKWIGSLRATSAPSSSSASQSPSNAAGQPVSGAPQQQQPPATAAPLTQQPAPASAPPAPTQQAPAPSAATAGASAAMQGAPAGSPASPAAQPDVPSPAAEGQQGETAGSAQTENRNATKIGRQPAVSVLVGSGVAAESAAALPPGMTTSVPIFVDEARLTAVSSPMPEYPHDALAKGVTGDVVVQAIVSRNGDVESAQIVSGPVGLLKSSVDAAREWKFKPYVEHGSPVQVRTYIRFRYRTQE